MSNRETLKSNNRKYLEEAVAHGITPVIVTEAKMLAPLAYKDADGNLCDSIGRRILQEPFRDASIDEIVDMLDAAGAAILPRSWHLEMAEKYK